MKRRIFAFLIIVLGGLTIVPAINLRWSPKVQAGDWRNKQFLYNMDFASEGVNLILSHIGISTDPAQVVIGRDGWLYLGDRYEQIRTVTRRGQTTADIERGQQIGSAAEAWEYWLKKKGVRVYRVMIAPDKGTIYPEHLPKWAKPSHPSTLDALVAGAGTVRYIDLRAPMQDAKSNSRQLLYFRTDTHWNTLGAGVAFRAFAEEVGRAAPELRWPTNDDLGLLRLSPRNGGDLARFLRISRETKDSEPVIKAQGLPIETTQYDFDSKEVIYRGGNPLIEPPVRPLLVISDRALNKTKVLWLRDSFGTAMSPLMAATFSDVVQLHWIEALKPGGRFVELIDKWKPDFVFITVVERLSGSELFTATPPLTITGPQPDFIRSRTFSSIVATNDVVEGSNVKNYRIDGPDPFIDYKLNAPVRTSEVPSLRIELSCADPSENIPMQLFWLIEGEPYFHESHSAKFALSPGEHIIDLSTIPDWGKNWKITRIRVDTDAHDKCLEFNLRNLELGTVDNH